MEANVNIFLDLLPYWKYYTSMMEMKIRRNEEMVKVGLRLPLQMKETIDEMAASERRSINDQVIVLLEKALKQTTEKRPA